MHTATRVMRWAVAGTLVLSAALARPGQAEEPAETPAPAAAAPASTRAEAEAPRAGEGASFDEEIVVTATRSPRPVRDVPAAVTVLPRAEIERSPSKTVDELLRIVPSFGLFRRTSSMVSDPTAQGVNLRGIGPSGVSRSLVLLDGIPANDPYGGWVYWRAMPLMDVERIEVVPGGGSALYGNYALGGVTQIFSRPIAPASFDAAAEYGSFGTYLLRGRVSDRRGPIGAAVEADLVASGGYTVVAPTFRGPIDGNAPSTHAGVNARVEATATPELSFNLRGGYFKESQDGGTEFTNSQVRLFGYSAGARYAPSHLGVLDLSVFGHAPHFDQDRARVLPPTTTRTSAVRAGSQSVPAHDVGVGLLWTSPALALAGTHTLSLGSDVRRITGATEEQLFPATVNAQTVVGRETSGEQRLYGVFVQDVYDVTRALAVNLAIRYDRWDNRDAFQVNHLQNGTTSTTRFADRSDSQVSPKVGLRLLLADGLTLRASAYRSFRAPTLNELYRPFQVGQVVTLANANLGPEKLQGAEAGLEVAVVRQLTTRVTGFWNDLDNPIVNVTVPSSTNLQQRQNLGRARIRGIEADAGLRLGRAWLGTAAYTFVDSRVTDAPGTQLVGKQLPQDPRHRASLSLAFDDPALLTAVAQVRYVGRQFEDDLNSLPMEAAVLVDLSASRRLTPNLEVVLAVENLLDREYLVGRAGGLNTIGQPRFIHGGLRVHLGH